MARVLYSAGPEPNADYVAARGLLLIISHFALLRCRSELAGEGSSVIDRRSIDGRTSEWVR